MTVAKKRGLGRGLEALLGPKAAAETVPLEAQPGETLRNLPVGQLQPGRYQPRTGMDQAKLSELAESIRAQGVICLLYTSPSPRDGLLSRMPSSA